MSRARPFRWIKDCAIWLSHPYREYDRRRNTRFPAKVEVTIALPLGTLEGRSVNLSRGGASALVSEAIAPGTVVFVRFPTIDRRAFASVRRCEARGDQFEVALEFRDGLTLDDRTMADFEYRRMTSPASWDDPFA